MTQEEALDIEPVTVREASEAIQPAQALAAAAPVKADGKQEFAVPALLRPREDITPQSDSLNDGADLPLIGGGSAAEPAPEPADVPAAEPAAAAVEAVDAEVIDSAGSHPAAAAPATPRRSRGQAKAAVSRVDGTGAEAELTQATAQEAAEPAPVPTATPQAPDPVEAGLQQIPRIATLLELDAAYGRVNQLLGSGRITDSAAERLWSAVARRRKELEGETP